MFLLEGIHISPENYYRICGQGGGGSLLYLFKFFKQQEEKENTYFHVFVF